MSRFEVRVSKDYLVFAAGHFITYDGQCEQLHGHNYRAGIAIEGDLDENHYVIDFTDVKKMMREIVDEMDHKMLLPDRNPQLELREEEGSIHVTYRKRKYMFPRSDVVMLPVPNTTAEMIAQYIAGRMKEALQKREGLRLSAIAVEVEESFGQSAWVREELG